MKLLSLVFACCITAVSALASSPVPYTEAVAFSCKVSPVGTASGGLTIVVNAETTAGTGGGVGGGESALATTLLRPGKQYPVSISGPIAGPGSAALAIGFTAPSGYVVFFDNTPTDIFSNTYSPGTINEQHTIEIRPSYNAAALGAGDFSGIQIGRAISWEVGLGGLRSGQSAGRILFRELDLTNNPASRDRLYYSQPLNNSQIPPPVTDVSSPHSLRQICTPQTVVNLVDDAGGGGYTIEFYPAAAASTWNNSVYTLIDQTAWKTIHVTSPAANQLTITETEGGVVRVSALVLSSGTVASRAYVWTLQEGDNTTTVRTTTHTSTVVNSTVRDDTVVVRTGGAIGTIVAKQKYQYTMEPWGVDEITQVTADPDGVALTTAYAYFTTDTAYGNYRKVQSVVGPTGNWVSYLYYDDWDRRGRVAVESHPYVDTPGSMQAAAISIGSSVSYDYVADYSGRFNAESNRQYKTTNIQTGQRLTTPNLNVGLTRFGQSYTTYVANNYSSATVSEQTTTEVANPNGANSNINGQLFSVKRPDQSQDSYGYYQGSYSGTTFTSGAGDYFRTNVWHGSTSSTGATALTTYDLQSVGSVYLVPYKSTMDVTIRNPAGLVVRSESWVCTAGTTFALVNFEDFTYDVAGRLTQRVASNSATIDYSYSDGRLAYTSDPTGIRTDFTYDGLGRVVNSTKAGVTVARATQDGVTTTYFYDGAGNIVQTVLSGGIGGARQTITTTAQYDLAGRITQQVQYSGSATPLTTSYAYSSGGKIVTATLPGGTATKVSEMYLDGQLKQVSGSGVVAENYSYSIYGAGQHLVQSYFGGFSSMWTKTYSDWLGRAVQQQKPGWSGAVVDKFWSYKTTGLLWKETQPGAAPTLYEYDTLGRLTAQGTDIDNNDILDRGGSDRIVERSNLIYTWDSGASWWALGQTYTYATTGSPTPTYTDSTISRLNLDPNNLGQTIAYDIHNNWVSQVTSVNRTSKLVTVTTHASDSNTDATQTIYNGQLLDAKDTVGVNMQYGYDVLGRQIQSTDPRTGTTTAAFVAGTNLVFTVTGAAGVYEAINQYDGAGRLIASAVPNPLYGIGGDTRSALYSRFSYNDRNQIYRQWGEIPAPVEYSYDNLGRKLQMTTYAASSANFVGNSWPTSPNNGQATAWSYQAATGLLSAKTTAAGTASAKTVSYSYTQAGQVSQRTWARGVVTNYSYYSTTGELSDVAYSSDPNSTAPLNFTYNRLGRANTVSDSTGLRTFAYDLPGTLELKTETLSASFYGSRILGYEYDTATSGALGRLKRFGLGVSGTPYNYQRQDYTYQLDGRLSSTSAYSDNISGNSQTFTYSYNSNHLIAQTSASPASYHDDRTYDLHHDWITGRSVTSTGATPKAAFAYTRDTLGRATDITKTGEIFDGYGASATKGLKTSFGYNDHSELKSETSKDLAASPGNIPGRQDSYVYDNLGNRTSVTHNGSTATYTPDTLLNRYTQRTLASTYDVIGTSPGSTVTVSRSGGATDTAARSGKYFFDAYPLGNGVYASAANPVTITDNDVPPTTITRQAYVAATPQSFTYDEDGNLTDDGRWYQLYDGENRLVWQQTASVASVAGVPNTGIRYYYDYLGRRTSKANYTWSGSAWVLGSYESYVYRGNNLIQVMRSSGGNLNSYWGLDLSGSEQGAGGVGGLVMTQDNGASYLPMYDGNGNIHGMITASSVTLGGVGYAAGSVVATYEYDAFGNTLRESGPYAATNPFRYSTKFTDIETGLVYYGLRYYSPSLGRFINRDPIEESGGLNLYSFCGNNGVNGYDLLGMTVPTLTWSQTTDFQVLTGTYVDKDSKGNEINTGTVKLTLTPYMGSSGGDFVSFKSTDASVTYKITKSSGVFGDSIAVQFFSPLGNSPIAYVPQWIYSRANTDPNNPPDPKQPPTPQNPSTPNNPTNGGGGLGSPSYIFSNPTLYAPSNSSQNYQALAAQLGWNGFPSNLSPSQQQYYGKTAADILALQAQGKDVSALWRAVISEVPGLITDNGGLIAGESADYARNAWLSSMNKSNVAVGATAGVFLFQITGRTPASAIEQMTMRAAMQGEGSVIMSGPFGDPLYQGAGWVKMQAVARGTEGNVTVHYMKNTITGQTAQYKFVTEPYVGPTRAGMP